MHPHAVRCRLLAVRLIMTGLFFAIGALPRASATTQTVTSQVSLTLQASQAASQPGQTVTRIDRAPLPSQGLRMESILLRILRAQLRRVLPVEGPGTPVPPPRSHPAPSVRPVPADRMPGRPPSAPSQAAPVDPCLADNWACILWAAQEDLDQLFLRIRWIVPDRARAVSSEGVFWLLLMLVIGWMGVRLGRAGAYWYQCRQELRSPVVPRLPRQRGWRHPRRAATIVALCLLLYGWQILRESSRAATSATSVITLNVTSTDLFHGCTSSVSLGTLTDSGDTGAFSVGRSITCTITTPHPAGYTAAWQVLTGSGGTSTGSMAGPGGGRIRPYTPAVSGTPEGWSVPITAAEWGARISSASDVVDTGVWGVDGGTEKWLNVGTGSLTIASRNTATDGDGDALIIGFRAEIGSSVTLPAGTYRVPVTVTAVTN